MAEEAEEIRRKYDAFAVVTAKPRSS